MVFILLLGAFLGAFAVVFAMDNSALVAVHMLSWSFTAPLAIVLISSAVFGIVITLLAMIPDAVQRSIDEYAARRELRREQRKAEAAAAAYEHERAQRAHVAAS
ncbi:MAG: hypothetical protein RLZZ416_607 [Candidatus Parcubacteria bacterium]|jgi:uncharacterized integral membrane protein